MSNPVNTPDGRFAVAVAELPLSAHRSAERGGSVVVISGDAGWGSRARAAAVDGAAAIVVRETRSHPEDEIATALASTAPVLVERGLLRPDVVSDARDNAIVAHSLVQVECSASSGELAKVARDAVGWGRVLAGGHLNFVASSMTSRGMCVLLERQRSDLGPLRVVVLASRRSAPSWIRAVALGSDRLQVTIDSARRSAVVERTTSTGRQTMPTRWESGERVLLRRALDVAVEVTGASDLADLEHDAVIAARSLSS